VIVLTYSAPGRPEVTPAPASAGAYDTGPALGVEATAPSAVAVAERTEVTEESEGEEASVIHVPLLAGVGLFVSAGFTVFFGLYPAPLIDFAHRATLLF